MVEPRARTLSPSRTKSTRSFFSRGRRFSGGAGAAGGRGGAGGGGGRWPAPRRRRRFAGALVLGRPSRREGVRRADRPVERRRQSSIAAMSDLTQNAVDVL